MHPEPEKKGLSRGCTVALIIGGAVFVLIAASLILFYIYRNEIGQWSFKKSVESEKMFIMNANMAGIDTVAVNKVADGFMSNISVEDFDLNSVPDYQIFVKDYATDMKVDSTEAEAFVQAMIACYPELEDMYMPDMMEEEMPDSTMMEEDSQ